MTKEIKRHFDLTTYVETADIKDIIKGIREVMQHDEEQDKKLKEYKREPIHLYIDSYGGSCYDGLTLANLMNECQTPIYTYCYGKAMSMGLYLFLQGDKRIIHEDGYLMYHQLSSGTWGKIMEMEEQHLRIKDLHKHLTKRILERVNDKGKKKVEKSNREKTDLFLTGEQSIKLGFATDLIAYKN